MADAPEQLPEVERRVLHVGDLRGGRNGQDPPASLSDIQCANAVNVDWNNGSKIVARRRLGCVGIDMTGSTMTLPIQSMHRHVPNSDETQAELWASDAGEVINRLSRGFRPAANVGFDSANNTGLWTPHTTFDPSAVFTINQRVKIDGNVYTINAVSNASFTTNERSTIDYSDTDVQPEGALWTAPTLVDPMIGPTIQTSWASLDSKLFIANQFNLDTFAHNRLHVWDATANSANGLMRRAGIAPSLVAPTANDAGSGDDYTDTNPRYYRTRWVERRFLPGFSNPLGNATVRQVHLTVGGTDYVAGFSAGPVSNTTLTVDSNLTVTLYASAGGGGGGGSNGVNIGGGAGGGGGASSNVGVPITLVGGKTYTLRIGTGGVGGLGIAPGANGGETFIHNDTDGVYLFRFDGGKGGASSGSAPSLAGGNGGAVLVGTGVPGGNGGGSDSGSVSNTVNYLLVGGGGGGAGQIGGGGGGGQVRIGTMVLSTGSYSVTVGTGGGKAIFRGQPGDGAASTFNGISANPGKGAQPGGQDSHADDGGHSGSGHIGGASYSGYPQMGGGGAGDSAVGGNPGGGVPGVNHAGDGGAGTASSISGSSVSYGGGGGAGAISSIGSLPSGRAGVGQDGGANGSFTGDGFDAPANRGGGGGGGAEGNNGGNGGSGVLVISYPTGSISISGGTVTTVGGNTVHTFTTTGTLIVNPNPGGHAGGPGGAGGGGAGGIGTGGSFVNPPSAGYAGGGSGAEAGQAADAWSVPGTLAHGGRGGYGGGSHIFVPGFADGIFGAGGPGVGGYPSGNSTGLQGQDGWCVLYFTAQTWVDGPAYDVTSGDDVWTPHDTSRDPRLDVIPSQQFLVNGVVYTVETVNSTTFTATPNAASSFSNQPIQSQQSVVYLRSEPSPSFQFTPSGNVNSDGVIVTPPFGPRDTENYVELEGSRDDATYYVQNTVPIAYPTVLDVSTYTVNGTFSNTSLHALSDPVGTYNLPQPARFVAGDQNRMLSFGSWDANTAQNRLEFSAVRGSLNIGDTERVPLGNFRDLDENDSGAPTGLIGPVFNKYFAFKTNQTWEFTPTGDAGVFAANAISKTVGAIPRTIVLGEDEFGNPALYWMSLIGAYRYIVNEYGQGRLQKLGGGIQDLLDGTTSSLVFSTVFDPKLGTNLYFHDAVYYPFLRQVWFYMLTSVEGVYVKWVFNIGSAETPTKEGYSSGWSIHTGPSVGPASVLFSRTIGAQMSHDLVPYVGPAGVFNEIWQTDVPGVHTDANTAYQANVASKAFTSGLHRRMDVSRCYALIRTSANAMITQAISGDDGEQHSSSAVSADPKANGQTWIVKRFDDAGIADVSTVQFTWGDAEALDQHWEIAEVAIETFPREIF